jgi:hypothetical protein
VALLCLQLRDIEDDEDEEDTKDNDQNEPKDETVDHEVQLMHDGRLSLSERSKVGMLSFLFVLFYFIIHDGSFIVWLIGCVHRVSRVPGFDADLGPILKSMRICSQAVRGTYEK